jgi:hypothetical protein
MENTPPHQHTKPSLQTAPLHLILLLFEIYGNLPNTKFFAWLILQDRVWTSCRFARRGWVVGPQPDLPTLRENHGYRTPPTRGLSIHTPGVEWDCQPTSWMAFYLVVDWMVGHHNFAPEHPSESFPLSCAPHHLGDLEREKQPCFQPYRVIRTFTCN